MNRCRCLRQLSLGLHSYVLVDIIPVDNNSTKRTADREDNKSLDPTSIQVLDLEYYHNYLFYIDLLNRCPEVRHLRLPRDFTHLQAQKLTWFHSNISQEPKDVHAELDTGCKNTLHVIGLHFVIQAHFAVRPVLWLT